MNKKRYILVCLVVSLVILSLINYKVSVKLYENIVSTIDDVETLYIDKNYFEMKISEISNDFYNSNTIVGRYSAYVEAKELKEVSYTEKARVKEEEKLKYYWKEIVVVGAKSFSKGSFDWIKGMIYTINPMNWKAQIKCIVTIIKNPIYYFKLGVGNIINSVRENGLYASIMYVLPQILASRELSKLISEIRYKSNVDEIEELNDFKKLEKSTTRKKYVKDGEQFVYAKNEKMLKPDIMYDYGDNYLYSTDDLGRIESVSTNRLELKNGIRNNEAQRMITNAVTDDGGHLIAKRFGGSGDIDNLVAMDRNINRGSYKKIENEMAKALEEGKKVSYNVNIKYAKFNKRPSKFNIKYCIDSLCTKQVLNNG